ncbi:2-C-methyl-D-erythritol 2,4-cyclodiphosphate synthase [Spiroplasma culicicola]|uniref:2-C-methyl-D-erythritol 2,4-cyclodiphosphate synthase n=1 Tax=Spiroplasma culicicola AES-1 TaxID=1276246 RepID=W6A911_9MOLU|nr:2-C-methyl-D-erythritol 2,4-cyclodiphosphate synthase [Spiroplasma culicicola]AHI53380.1 2-C-methyl-D-erythritol 2,4-cyclodiphosphate synthase [Spiroplasma culicicola AES-1]
MFRTGISKDIHKLIEGNYITLANQNIKCEFKVDAYSDGDVLLHAICEALLGALGLSDLGTYYNSKTKPQGFSSLEIAQDVIQHLQEANYKISNIDTIIILDKPNLKKHKELLKQSVANIFDLALNQISIKATTSENTATDVIEVISNVLIYKGEN